MVQDYPRIRDENDKYYGFLDDSQLVQHTSKIPIENLKEMVTKAIISANRKSSRDILSIANDADDLTIQKMYEEAAKDLFNYFRQYVIDPAGVAHQMLNKHYRQVGEELFRNRTIQKERMNSGWRYQYLVVDAARASQRFVSVSDIGAAEADFNAVINRNDNVKFSDPLSLYVSVKNRSDTVGGQDYPKAVRALEDIAKNDRNRLGAYCGVMGIVMETGGRKMRKSQKTKQPHSYNVEMWLSDFFWPFFANYSYEEIITAVLEVLMDSHQSGDLSSQITIPDELLDEFGNHCKDAGLIDDDGLFDDPYALVQFFCEA